MGVYWNSTETVRTVSPPINADSSLSTPNASTVLFPYSYLHRVPPLWKGSSKTGPLVAYRPYCVPLTVFDCHGKYRRALSEQDTQHCRHYNIRWSLHTRRDGGSRDRIVPDRRWEVHEDGSRASQTRIRGDQGVHGSERIGEHQGTREVPALCEIEAESSRSTQLGALLCNPELEICNR